MRRSRMAPPSILGPNPNSQGRQACGAICRGLTGAGLIFALFAAAGLANGANLTVIVQQVEEKRGGSIEANLYDDRSTYRSILMSGAGRGVYAGRVPARGNAVEILIRDVAPGTYAIGVYHDENNDRKLNTRFIPIPKEGVGAGNDAVGRFGPPSFDKSAIKIGAEDLTTIINLDY